MPEELWIAFALIQHIDSNLFLGNEFTQFRNLTLPDQLRKKKRRNYRSSQRKYAQLQMAPLPAHLVLYLRTRRPASDLHQ